jgi:formylglycine-generating enzyme required for sulfatase activity
MKSKLTEIAIGSVLVLLLSLLVISCSKDSSNPADPGSNGSNTSATPSAPSPADGATLIPTTVGLKWSCTASSGETITYDVYLGTTNPPTATVATNTSQTTLAQTGLPNLTAHYWQVVAKSSKGGSTKSPVWQFTTGIFGMVPIQGGTFTMGNDASTDTYLKPAHSVTLSGFFMCKYEVVQKQWREIVQWKQGSALTPLNPSPSYTAGDSLPVTHVSWDDIQIWLGYLNEKEGFSASTKKYRLPTEAEWEFAARGGVLTHGYKYSGSDMILEVGWTNSNTNRLIQKVGTLAPNELGIYDMSGNVMEWCNDWWGVFSSGAQTNPTGPTTGQYKVMRNGSALQNSDWCYVWSRDFEAQTVRFFGGASGNYPGDGYGFRYVKTQ